MYRYRYAYVKKEVNEKTCVCQGKMHSEVYRGMNRNG